MHPIIKFQALESDNAAQVKLVVDILMTHSERIEWGPIPLAHVKQTTPFMAYFESQSALADCCVDLLRRCTDLPFSRFVVREY